jgi:hypothetical protein
LNSARLLAGLNSSGRNRTLVQIPTTLDKVAGGNGYLGSASRSGHAFNPRKMTQDFSRRFSIIVRSDLEPWQIMNTVSHIAAKLGRAAQEFETGPAFIAKDGFTIPRNSQYPIIVFAAKGSDAIRSLVKETQELSLPHLVFIREMIDFTDDEELQAALAVKNESDIEYLGIGVFGENEILKRLTKKFSLWK